MVTLVVDHFQVPLGGRRFWFEDCGKVEEKLTGTVKVTCDMDSHQRVSEVHQTN